MTAGNSLATEADTRREVAAILDALSDPTDARQAFAALGAQGLFAPHYPVKYGGRDRPVVDYMVVAEALGMRDLADVAHLVTVQGVGCALLEYGSDSQRQRLLPRLVAGKALASLLMSERTAGSDAAAIKTSARRTPRGWLLNGVKSWSMHTDWSAIGLCTARTENRSNKYEGITTFVVDMAKPGVRIAPVRRAAGAPYFDVHLEDVLLDDDDVVGEVGDGWRVITAAAAFERSGIDYLSRGLLWLSWAEEAAALISDEYDDARWATITQLHHDLIGARALTWRTAMGVDGYVFDETQAAYSKYVSGSAAQAVGRFIARELLPLARIQRSSELAARLRRPAREYPELSIAGNAVDLMLDAIAADPWLGES